MKYFVLVNILLLNLIFALAQPSGIYYFNWVDGVYGLQVVNISTGSVSKNVNLTSIPYNVVLQNFLDFDQDGNFIVLSQLLSQQSIALLTISVTGEVISQSNSVPSLKKNFSWFSTSVQYDAANQIVYIGGLGDDTQMIEVYNFVTSQSYVMDVKMPYQYAATCTFDGVNQYFMLDPNYQFNNFSLYTYSFNEKSIAQVEIEGFPSNTYPCVFFTNNQIYVVNSNYTYSEFGLYSIDVKQGQANPIVEHFSFGVASSVTFWYSDNYFVYLLEESNSVYVVMVDLSTGIVSSKVELQAPLVNMEMISFLV